MIKGNLYCPSNYFVLAQVLEPTSMKQYAELAKKTF